MPVTPKLFQMPRQLLSLAIFFGVLILLMVIINNKLHDTPENLQNVRNPIPPTAQDLNTAATNGTSTPATAPTNGTPTSFVSGQSDPFRAFLEAHKNDQQSSANPQPVQQNPQTPQEIQNRFQEAVKNQQALSTANPFATERDTKH